jgi:hypothetical protein
MRRKKFFENIVNISKFGLLGTFFTFIFYGLLTWGAFSAIKFTMVDPNKNNSYTDFHLGVKDIFYLCSLLSSSDIIAAVTLVKYSE